MFNKMAFLINGIIQQIGNTESISYQDKVFKKESLSLIAHIVTNLLGR